MKFRLVIEDEARRDFDEAVEWYEQQQAGLGDTFIDEMEAVIARVLERPAAGAGVPYAPSLDVRWRLAPRFPYAVIYRIEESTIRVFAFAHLSRKPGFWRKP